MKRNFILFTATALIGYVTFSSNSAGPAKVSSMDRTASATATCGASGCHSAAVATTAAAVTLTDSATGLKVTQFVPNKTYIIEVGGTNTSGYKKWGFQVTLKNAAGNSVGTVTEIDATKTHITTLGTVKVMEHSAPITTATSTGEVLGSFKWKAPAKGGTGTISLNAVINAVDGDGSVLNDKPSNVKSVFFAEDVTAIRETANLVNSIYPNPANSMLNLSLQNIAAGDYSFIVTDMLGRQISSEQKTLNSSSTVTNVDISALAQGNYLLQVRSSDAIQAVPFTKL